MSIILASVITVGNCVKEKLNNMVLQEEQCVKAFFVVVRKSCFHKQYCSNSLLVVARKRVVLSQ